MPDVIVFYFIPDANEINDNNLQNHYGKTYSDWEPFEDARTPIKSATEEGLPRDWSNQHHATPTEQFIRDIQAATVSDIITTV